MKEMTYLTQKVRIIAFLEYIDSLDVELLVIKTMSLELVKGSIDEASETVEIEWMMPQYLNKEHLTVLI
jgi:hypothetical protein